MHVWWEPRRKRYTEASKSDAPNRRCSRHRLWVSVAAESERIRPYSFCIRPRPRFSGGRFFGCSIRMMGNLQVRFLEGWAPAMAPSHSTAIP